MERICQQKTGPVPAPGRDQVLVQLPGLGRRCASTSRRCSTASAPGSTSSPSCSFGCARWTRRSWSPRPARACRCRRRDPRRRRSWPATTVGTVRAGHGNERRGADARGSARSGEEEVPLSGEAKAPFGFDGGRRARQDGAKALGGLDDEDAQAKARPTRGWLSVTQEQFGVLKERQTTKPSSPDPTALVCSFEELGRRPRLGLSLEAGRRTTRVHHEATAGVKRGSSPTIVLATERHPDRRGPRPKRWQPSV